MKDILKSVSDAEGWEFIYARRDYQNLFDEEPVANQVYIFLDPVTISDVNNDYGTPEYEKHSGTFMVVSSSDIDEGSYEIRFDKYIKPILDNSILSIREAIYCENDVKIDVWKKTEIINALDFNFDGVVVEFQITFSL